MALTKEERIIRLRRGIASSETSDSLKKMMQEELHELMKPEVIIAPVPEGAVKIKKPAVKKAVKKVKEPAPVVEVKALEPPVLTQEDKDRLKAEIQRNLAKKKAKQAEEN